MRTNTYTIHIIKNDVSSRIAHWLQLWHNPKTSLLELILRLSIKTIITTTSDNSDIQRRMFQLTSVPLLSDLVVTFFSWIILLTQNGNCWFVPLLHSVSDVTYHIVGFQDAESFLRSWWFLSYPRNFPHCMESQGSLPCAKQSALLRLWIHG